MRVLHFSDTHLSLGLRRVPLPDWLGKRLIGAANLLRGRGRSFEGSARKTAALVRRAREMEPDLAICSGDLTALGTNPELEAAAELVEPLRETPGGFVVIPGNHDVYSIDTIRQARFERYFDYGLATDRPDLRTDDPWPLVRLVGEDTAVVAVNSARPNPLPWKSSGRIPDAQIAGLRAALADPDVRRRFVFVVVHYAPRRPDGRPDTYAHGLRNADAFLSAVADLPRGVVLCGHIHRTYRVRVPGVRPELFCAGSATIDGREGCWLFEREEDVTRARRGSWDGLEWAFGPPEPVEAGTG